MNMSKANRNETRKAYYEDLERRRMLAQTTPESADSKAYREAMDEMRRKRNEETRQMLLETLHDIYTHGGLK